MSEIQLERLRAARLHRQRSAPDVDTLVADSLGLHSTDYATPYLSARARVADFDPAVLFARLDRAEGLVRVNCFRNTVHVVRTADLPLISAATGEAVVRTGRRSPNLKGVSDDRIRRGREAIVEVLEAGPASTNDLKRALPDLAPDLRYWLLIALGSGEVLRADAPHARSNRSRYALARHRIPGFVPGEIPAAEARRELLVRAVRAFGPLTIDDLAWWLPATRTEVKAALAWAGAELGSLEAEGSTFWFAAELEDEEAPPREDHGAWALPYEDALLKGYRDRAWCLATGLKEVVFPYSVSHWHPPDGTDPGPGPHKGVNVTGEARPSLWWGGRVVGRWEEGGGTPVWQVHGPLPAAARAEVEAEVAAVAAFLADRLLPLCTTPS
ncbi:MAG: winged helix DNA-binding domain-containing protein [Myxococcales bacterium]|nr:winged helix DNA-binding domain-containing protein [Myxococcales bacterium]